MQNTINLGLQFRPTDAEVSEYILDRKSKDPNFYLPRRIRDYWLIKDQCLMFSDSDALDKRIFDAYGATVSLPRSGFVTDDVNVFVELYRVLSLDFVYDFRTKLFFIDMYASHECLMASFYEALTGSKGYDYDKGDKYILTGMGMFRSSQSKIIYIGPDVPVPEFFRPWKSHVQVLV